MKPETFTKHSEGKPVLIPFFSPINRSSLVSQLSESDESSERNTSSASNDISLKDLFDESEIFGTIKNTKVEYTTQRKDTLDDASVKYESCKSSLVTLKSLDTGVTYEVCKKDSQFVLTSQLDTITSVKESEQSSPIQEQKEEEDILTPIRLLGSTSLEEINETGDKRKLRNLKRQNYKEPGIYKPRNTKQKEGKL